MKFLLLRVRLTLVVAALFFNIFVFALRTASGDIFIRSLYNAYQNSSEKVVSILPTVRIFFLERVSIKF